MNRRTMEEYIKKQDNFFSISDLVTYKMQEEGFNFVVASPPLVIPSKEFNSDIRYIKNYEQEQNQEEEEE